MLTLVGSVGSGVWEASRCFVGLDTVRDRDLGLSIPNSVRGSARKEGRPRNSRLEDELPVASSGGSADCPLAGWVGGGGGGGDCVPRCERSADAEGKGVCGVRGRARNETSAGKGKQEHETRLDLEDGALHNTRKNAG